MDALAPVLGQFRFRSDLYCLLEGAGSWGLSVPAAGDTAYVHCLRRGRSTVQVGSDEFELAPGDLLLLPHGDAHDVLGEPGNETEPLDIGELLTRRAQRADRVHLVGRGRSETELVCGGYAFDRNGFNPLLDFLPTVVFVSAAASAESRVEAILAAAVHELTNPGPGSDLALERLAELILISALRSCIDATEPDGREGGWLRALSDPPTAAALHAIHAEPEQPWTLAQLAERAAVSRSTLTARFRTHLGLSPLRYLARWRMLTAASYLTSTSLPLGEIAARVGYSSDSAFNKAFKAEFGVPPGEFRRDRSSA